MGNHKLAIENVSAVARAAGSLILSTVILGLAPQALCSRPLRGLFHPHGPNRCRYSIDDRNAFTISASM